METLPLYIPCFFIATTLATVALFYKATQASKSTLLILTSWLSAQFFIARTGFYTNTTGVPPRFVLLLLPPLVLMGALFSTRRGRAYICSLDTRWLTLLHAVRIPVEIVLYQLFLHNAVPQLMTFDGRNFDILSGLTAPLIFYLHFISKKLSRKALLIWNVAGLLLLLNIVAIAILSAPFKFQKFGFGHPNIAILYFPFVWLPAVVVPLVLLSHLASIYQLMAEKKNPLALLPLSR